MSRYRIVLTPDDNDTFLVTCPAFPEVATFGEDEAACRAHGLLAVEEAIAARMKAGVDVPVADDQPLKGRQVLAIHTPLLTELKADLYRALRAAGVSRAELARRLAWSRNSVDRLFDTNHASRLDQIEAAMAALGYRVDVEMVALETA